MAELTVIVLLVVVFSTTTFAVRSVSISKCCNADEMLVPDQSDFKCVKNVSSSWHLRIFVLKNQTFTTFSTLPAHWKIVHNNKPNCVGLRRLSYEALFNFPVSNGSFLSVEYNTIFHPNQYCLDYTSALVCMHPEHITRVTVKKCCGENAIFSQTNQSCVLFNSESYKIDVGPNKTLVAGFPRCKENKHQPVARYHESELFSNGSLLANGKMLLPPGNFCLEHIFEHSALSPSVISCSEYVLPYVSQSETHDFRFTIYPIGLALSAVFLAATLAAGSLLPASHHVLHWRCQTNHVVCLLVGDVLLCITHLSGRIEYGPCFAIGESILENF
ncbi:hypothetical protein NQ315_010775 [Exocentrus adspersus]|uniref:Methuselah N-terminal domain-containing protein n=1 Tax=Exocentrus adspersus TaxID=1586481 RepID=A0AAV8VUW6_9CUCU|nr:hypothetical protein NQ315_010775 [Exocentrus adspersus]